MTDVDVIALYRLAAAAAVNAQAETARSDTAEHAPKDTSALAESITTDTANARDLTARISSDLDYAVRQHEDFDLQHPHGGGPKYMEKAVTGAATRGLADTAADAARRVIGR